ncbi:AAA family ATPase [Erwinia mallotivora]|uniref:AAA family ATPase n=1 Tax=Erwinia mallotivora TaxID=69222 RepID=UPI0035F0373B
MKKLIFLYGPPAVGKLTVGGLLAAQTAATLFHNHLTYDLAVALLPQDSGFDLTKQFACKIRLYTLSLLFAQRDNDVITTFCYEGSKDDEYIAAIKTICEKHRVTPCFVQLCSDEAQLLSRVKNSDRARFGKVNTQDALQKILSHYHYCDRIEAAFHLRLSTTDLTAEEVVRTLTDWLDAL